jgi:hypothetical protein
MITIRWRTAFGFTLALVLLCTLGFMLSSSAVPTQAGFDSLPSRSTPTPVPIHPANNSDNNNSESPVSRIELYTQPTQAGLWAVVQWSDSAGSWHDVDGWKGSVDSGFQTWGVFQSEFGRGPFRWVVSQGSGGKIVGTSASFNLPGQKETATIRVSLTS